MKTRDIMLRASSFWLLLAMVAILSDSLSVQAQFHETTVTDSRNPTGTTTPTRVTVTRTQHGGRTIETRIVESPSINGGYAPLLRIEQQTIQLNPNAETVVTRQYSPDGNGNQRLLQVTEEQRSTAAGGRQTVTRTTSNADVNGRFQDVQREVHETVLANDDTRQTTSTVSLQTANGLQPVQRSQQVEWRKGNVAEQQTTVLVPGGSGDFVPRSRIENTTTTTASGQTKDERIYWDNGLGYMTVIQRDVTSESKDARGTHNTTQTYSAFVPGASPAPGSLVLVQQVSSSQQTAADGSSQSKQEIQAINVGDPASGLQLATSVTEVSEPVGNGQTKGQVVVRSSDGNGAFQVVRVTDSQQTRVIP